MAIDAKPKPSVRAKIQAKRAAGECFQCDSKKGKGTRHLCSVHFSRFHQALAGLSKAERATAEAAMIKEGMVDESRQGQRGVNEYRELINS